MKGILKTGFFLALASAGIAQAADQAIVDHYNKSCTICHAAGVAGAPKTGDAAQWAPRLEKGMAAMLHSVDKGLNAMPPKGMCNDCSPADVQALIEYMAEAK